VTFHFSITSDPSTHARLVRQDVSSLVLYDGSATVWLSPGGGTAGGVGSGAGCGDAGTGGGGLRTGMPASGGQPRYRRAPTRRGRGVRFGGALGGTVVHRSGD
jgi:hypothetical protein